MQPLLFTYLIISRCIEFVKAQSGLDIFADMVFLLVKGDIGILYGLCGAVGYAGHAVGAGGIPDRPLIRHGYIVHGTDPAAFAAAYAFIRGIKILRWHHELHP